MVKFLKPLALVLLFFTGGGCVSLLYYPSRENFSNKKTFKVQPREVNFTSRDGIPLHGWYFKNKIKRRPNGVLVFFHGNAENLTTHYTTLHWILSHGYDYFIFDYQGYGKSSGRPSPRGTVDDGIGALLWVHRNHPTIPLVVFGQSLGGAVALRTVIEAKRELPIAMVVVDSAFPSYRAVARSVLARHWLTWIFQPLGYLLMSDQYAPGRRVAEISPIPLLVFHGERDGVVSYRLGRKIFEWASPPKEFISLPEGRHIDAFWGHEGKYRKILLNRLNRHLLP